MRLAMLLLILGASHGALADLPGALSSRLALEYRHFTNAGSFESQKPRQASVVFEAEYVLAWNEDRSVFTFEPIARADQMDSERSIIDIRELSLITSWDVLELRVGISSVFWGVTESQHVVDVINQIDAVENPDGEEKLGQPMINATFVTNRGNVELFLLPYFRERTFAGRKGRYRGPFIVNGAASRFTNGAEERHVDYAIRWTGYAGDFDWGISWFQGTDREPLLLPDNERDALTPTYGQARQFGVELQHIYKDLLTKAELRYKESDLVQSHLTSAIGVELTLYGMSREIDVGLLYEWLYDSRHDGTPSGTGNASFLGARLAMNDAQSSHALAGLIVDHGTGRPLTFRLEASRRIKRNLSLDLEVNLVAAPPRSNLLHHVRSDNYLQLTINAFL